VDLRIMEASNGFNYGKFGVGLFTAQEWQRRSRLPGWTDRPLLASLGWSHTHLWVLDLQTGEGGIFEPTGLARADLDKHDIWVCPLFEPFLTWLYGHHRSQDADLADWHATLPEFVELPDAPSALYGYRRHGRRPHWQNVTA
jgi:hypothetical protein